jgi:outer membrane lipoprotein-sorting protein
VSKNDERSLVGLRLVPRAGTTEAKDWSTIDLWYDRGTWWPIGVLATETNGDARRIRLANLKAHEQLPEESALLLSIDEPGEGWSVDVRPWVN